MFVVPVQGCFRIMIYVSIRHTWHSASFVSRPHPACMAMAAIVAASVLLLITGETKGNPSITHFWRPALTCTVASPFGCEGVTELRKGSVREAPVVLQYNRMKRRNENYTCFSTAVKTTCACAHDLICASKCPSPSSRITNVDTRTVAVHFCLAVPFYYIIISQRSLSDSMTE